MKIVNGDSSELLFDHKALYVRFERMPGFTPARNSLALKKFSINILKCIYVLQFW